MWCDVMCDVMCDVSRTFYWLNQNLYIKQPQSANTSLQSALPTFPAASTPWAMVVWSVDTTSPLLTAHHSAQRSSSDL
jgi:hypothetical protein